MKSLINQYNIYSIVPTQGDKMRAESADLNYCAVPFFKPCRSAGTATLPIADFLSVE